MPMCAHGNPEIHAVQIGGPNGYGETVTNPPLSEYPQAVKIIRPQVGCLLERNSQAGTIGRSDFRDVGAPHFIDGRGSPRSRRQAVRPKLDSSEKE